MNRKRIQTRTQQMFGIKNVQYFQLLREANQEYLNLFVDWVKHFDQ